MIPSTVRGGCVVPCRTTDIQLIEIRLHESVIPEKTLELYPWVSHWAQIGSLLEYGGYKYDRVGTNAADNIT